MKTLLLVLALLCLPAQSWAMEKFVDYVQDTKGNIITGVTVTVYNQGTLVKATIYSDNGITTRANPFTNATDGIVKFYAANGRYDIVYTKVGYTFTAANTTDRTLFDILDVGSGTGAPTAGKYWVGLSNVLLTAAYDLSV